MNEIYCFAQTDATSARTSWVTGVASSGQFYYSVHAPSGLWTIGTSGIPSGWTYDEYLTEMTYSDLEIDDCLIDSDVTTATLRCLFYKNGYDENGEYYHQRYSTTKTVDNLGVNTGYESRRIEVEIEVHGLTATAVIIQAGRVFNALQFTAETAGATVQLTTSSADYERLLEYTTDGQNWTPYSTLNGATLTLQNVGDKIGFRATNEYEYLNGDTDKAENNVFVITGNVACKGSIMYLLSPVATVKDAPGYCFQRLFNGCTGLTTAPELPSTTIGTYCYRSTFNGCTALRTAPELPATNLGTYCYMYMFKDCRALTTAPELPATTLADRCYEYMFQGCTGITNVPTLPATTLTPYCYYFMFDGCTSLYTYAQSNFKATTMATYSCGYMFQGCTKLPGSPLSLTKSMTLDTYCFYRMFSGCTSLTSTNFGSSSTVLKQSCCAYMFQGCTSITSTYVYPTTLVSGCYNYMYQNCSKLSSIHVGATSPKSPGTSYTSNWLSGVASSGTFYYKSGVTWTSSSASGCPSGWTKTTY